MGLREPTASSLLKKGKKKQGVLLPGSSPQRSLPFAPFSQYLLTLI